MADTQRLDVPRGRTRSLSGFLRLNPDAVGNFAEGIARFLGHRPVPRRPDDHRDRLDHASTWSPSGCAWDPYPFILLNLAFSTQAAYAAPLILLAQNRQADRDRVQAEEDRARAASIRADTEYLARELASLRVAVGELATRDFIRGELGRLLDEDAEKREKKAKKKREPGSLTPADPAG